MKGSGKEQKDSKDLNNERYILLKDTPGSLLKTKKIFGVSYGSEEDGIKHALRGELFQMYREKQLDESEFIALISIENKNLCITSKNEYVRPLTPEEFEILYAVPSKSERFHFLNSSQFPEILMIQENDYVRIKLESRGSSEQDGKVRYMGSVPHKKGKFFGIVFEIAIGDMDGMVDGVRLFHANNKCGTVVSAERILKCYKSNPSNKKRTIPRRTTHIHKMDQHDDFAIGSRVIYFDENEVRRGTIRFIGYVSKDDNRVYVGVEFDNERRDGKLGNVFNGKKVFDCPKNKGFIARPEELLKEFDYDNKGKTTEKTVEVQATPGKRQIELEQFQYDVLSGKAGKKPKNSDSGSEKKIHQKEIKRNVLREQHHSLPVESSHGKSHTAVENLAIDDMKRLKEIQFEKEERDRSIESASKDLDIHIYEEISVVNKASSSNQNTDDSIDNKNGNNSHKGYNLRSSTHKLNKDDLSGERTQVRVHSTTEKVNLQMKTVNKPPLPEQTQGGANKEMPKNQNSAAVNTSVDNEKRDTINKEDREKEDDDTKENGTKNLMDLSLETMVEVHINNKSKNGQSKPCYGVVKWVGYHEGIKDLLVGLELEDYDGQTDGTFHSKRYFTCPANKGTFLKAKKCRPDERFGDQQQQSSNSNNNSPATEPPAYEEVVGFVQPGSKPGNFLPPRCLMNEFLGKGLGIQGHHNSCYMDATLFAMFSYAHVFDVALHRRKRKNDIDDYEKVQKILKEGIVNPLRVNGKVHRTNVLDLRKYINKHTTQGGFLDEEKDPEEFVVLLFEKVLKVDPFITLQMNDNHNAMHLYQLFPPPEERRNTLPSIQFLLELSFLNSNLKIKETPSVLILQMPRFGTVKMFKRLFINPTLDLSPVLQNILHHCEVCGEHANIQCPQCACETFGLNKVSVYLCSSCYASVHKNSLRKDHEEWSLEEGEQCTDLERNKLELFAVVSITTSHYVSFVKCGGEHDSEWVFFDSMADRCGGEDGYNIPEVTKLEKLKDFLHGKPFEVADLDNKKSDEKILRFYEDASLCFYRNKRFMMYK